jgi:hypothetical protein
VNVRSPAIATDAERKNNVVMGSERPGAYAALLNCLQIPKRPLQTVLGFNVGTVLMYGIGGRHGE